MFSLNADTVRNLVLYDCIVLIDLGQRKRQAQLAATKDGPVGETEGDQLDSLLEPAQQASHDDATEPVETGQEAGLSVLSVEQLTDQGIQEALPGLDQTLSWTSPELSLSFADFPPPTEISTASLSSDIIGFTFPSLGAIDSLSPSTGSGTGSNDESLDTAQPSSLTSDSGGNTPFPDSYYLPMIELTLLRAMLRIATRLNATSLWKADALSPFNLGMGPPAEQLPSTWQPTSTQILLPHHPVFDLLPWPSCRDRIISVMNLPESERPPMAQDPLALMNFVYDVEDGAEGMRIWGDDPYDEKNWEVGQKVFGRWWFIFDRAIVERSNYWRQLRGAPNLCMGTGSDA